MYKHWFCPWTLTSVSHHCVSWWHRIIHKLNGNIGKCRDIPEYSSENSVGRPTILRKNKFLIVSGKGMGTGTGIRSILYEHEESGSKYLRPKYLQQKSHTQNTSDQNTSKNAQNTSIWENPSRYFNDKMCLFYSNFDSL